MTTSLATRSNRLILASAVPVGVPMAVVNEKREAPLSPPLAHSMINFILCLYNIFRGREKYIKIFLYINNAL